MDSAYAKALAKGFEELRKKLDAGEISEDCQKNVIDKLPKDFSLKSFSNYLSRGAAFEEGTRSRRRITSVISQPQGAPYTARTTYGLKAEVWRIFDVDKTARFYTADKASAVMLTVFFRETAVSLENGGSNNENYAAIFHEALHGYGASINGGELPVNYGDDGLEIAILGYNAPDSKELSKYIREHCFK